MWSRLVRLPHARLALGLCAAQSTALAYALAEEKRVYVSGEALGRAVRLEYWKAKHENVEVLDLENEAIQLRMAGIRDAENEGKKFVHDADGLLRSVIDCALTVLPNDDEAVVTTPRGHKVKGVVFEDDIKICGVPVSSKSELSDRFERIFRTTLPFDSPTGHIVIQSEALEEKIVNTSLPEDVADYEMLLLYPVFSSYEKLSKVIHYLLHQGVKQEKLTVVTLVTCPEAADKFCQDFGDARLVTAAFDTTRDKQGFVVPGLGDFEARYAQGLAQVNAQDKSSAASSSFGWWPFGSKK